ncbi:hypothetical protein BGW38_003917, partial [Lunasporangiospora selenospora]
NAHVLLDRLPQGHYLGNVSGQDSLHPQIQSLPSSRVPQIRSAPIQLPVTAEAATIVVRDPLTSSTLNQPGLLHPSQLPLFNNSGNNGGDNRSSSSSTRSNLSGSGTTSGTLAQPYPLSTQPSYNSLHQQYQPTSQGPSRTPSSFGAYAPPPATLRPDSICSYPDSSPLMAPHVLAAVDARLRLSRSFDRSANSSSINLPGPAGGAGVVTLANNRPGSRASVMTHYSALHGTEGIRTREQLYDYLNRDDGDDEDACTVGGSGSGAPGTEGLQRPKPNFMRSSSATSSRSSVRSSFMSSAFAGSEIELNVKRSSMSNMTKANMAAGQDPKSSSLSSSTGSSETVATEAIGGPSSRTVGGKNAPMNKTTPTVMGAEQSTGPSKLREKTILSSDDDYIGMTNKIEKSAWLKSKSRNHRRWRGICCVVGLLALVAVITGITLGFVLRRGKIDGLAPPPPDGNNGNNGNSTDGNTNRPQPPLITQFKPDPNLRKAFYGLAYNPAKTLMPWCGASLQSIVNDMILLSQITNRVRLYGMDCDQADLTFQAIRALKLESQMKVVLTMWVDNNSTTVQRQYDTLFRVMDTYGTDMIEGISVGNEVLFQKYIPLTELGTLMQKVRSEVKSRYSKNIPIFTSDVGSNMNAELASYSDQLQGNIHPYFSGTPAASAANWTFSEYKDKISANPVSSGLKGVISEVGWPTAPISAVYQKFSVPGVEHLQTLVDTFVCQANTAGIPYYWFELKDEPWKQNPDVPVEPYWGIFDKDGKLKIKIPNCIAP